MVSVTAQTTEYNGVTYKINPRNLSFWFKDYKGLKSFDGVNINMKSDEQSLESLFEGCTSLAVLNFSGWEWDGDMERTNMLANLPALSSLTIKRVVLEGTGLGLDVNGKELAARAANVGRWVMDNNIVHDVPWFGPTAKLVSRYDVILSVAIDDEHMYTWDSKYAGSRVDNNPNAWWIFSLVDDEENDVKKGTLIMGSDASEDRDINKSGTATLVDGKMEYSGSTLQWALSPGTTVVKTGTLDNIVEITEDLIAGIPNIAAVKHVSTFSTLVPQDTMLGWFANMVNLESFDGTFLDVSHVTNFNGLFAGCKKLAYVKIGNWIMHDAGRDADVTDMFRDCQSLYKLTVGKGVVLSQASGLSETLTNREPDKGTWIYNLWFGSSSDLADDYTNAGISSAADALYTSGSVVSTEITYTWDEGNLGGRFPSNPNVWWRYTGVVRDGMVGLRVGLLRIGSDSEDNNAITETSVQLPWRKLLKNVNTITEVRTAADGSYPVSVKDLSGWFGTYLAADNSTRAHTGLDTFKGEGFILDKPGNECISLEGMFDGATKLAKATGMEHWKTSTVRSFVRMFYACQVLYDLDIQDWDMTTAHIQDTPTTQDMFHGMGSFHMGLASLTLGPNAVLEGTNLAFLLPNQQEGRTFHNTGDGVWVMGDALNSDAITGDTDTPWWDTTAALVERYKLDKTAQRTAASIATKTTPGNRCSAG